MALPASDNFNRSNANPIGGNWTFRLSDMQLLSNAVRSADTGDSYAWWNADAFGANHWSECKITTASDGGPAVRCSSSGCYYWTTYSDGEVWKCSMDAGSWTKIGECNFTVTASDVVRIEATGEAATSIKVYKNGVQQGTTLTDTSSPLTSGSAGVYSVGATILDDWQGDNVAATSWWDVGGASCLAAYQPKGAASQAASYVNLANPGTYDAAPGTAPTWAAATGWTFDGSTQYLTTGCAPSANCSLIVRFSGITNTGGALLGTRSSAAGRCYVRADNGAGQHNYYRRASSISLEPALTSGVLALTVTDGYLDGVSESSIFAALYEAPPAVFIGCYNYSGTPSIHVAGNILACAIYDNTLSAAQIAAITTAMNAISTFQPRPPAAIDSMFVY